MKLTVALANVRMQRVHSRKRLDGNKWLFAPVEARGRDSLSSDQARRSYQSAGFIVRQSDEKRKMMATKLLGRMADPYHGVEGTAGGWRFRSFWT